MTVTETSGSKKRLIQAAISLISTRGYENTGIQEILDRAGVSKSNFYYHFKSKEALCLDAIDALAHEFVTGKINATIANPALPPRERFVGFFDVMHRMMVETRCSGGCPVVNLATETSDFHPAFREKIAAFFNGFLQAIEEAYRAGVGTGDFRDDIAPEHAARLILASMNGTMVQAKVMKSADIIRQDADTLLRLISRPA